MSFFKPKKSLGQHILKDTNIAKKIVDSLTLKDCSGILEVGPGTGILTEFILNLGMGNKYFVEIDSSAIEILKRRFNGHNNRIIHEDFLKLDLRPLFPGKFAVIGNFPYNLSSQIFFKILENKDKVAEVVCMVQKEVAERISSSPGNKDYGILSVLLQTYYDIEYLFTVSESVFYPRPKVKSSVLRLLRNDRNEPECDRELFFRVVKAGFNQRRKILRNSLKSILLNLEINDRLFQMRPEQLSVEEFIILTNKIEEGLKKQQLPKN
jgi:16S rRNA (adenine1518-N6/adenine1519-N6)-dimethyltransferase